MNILNQKDLCGASIGRNTTLSNSMKLEGNYSLTCLTPRDEDRARYAVLRDKATKFAKRSKFWQWVTMPFNKAALAEYANFPLVEKWTSPIDNLVTTVGGNLALDTVLSGSAYTAAWYIGLIGSTGYTTGAALGDTMALHGGWAEESACYSNATRPAPSFSAASAKSKATSAPVAFTITSTATIKGCFLNSVSTKGGTTGTLYSAGLFTGGDQVVNNLDTLNVTYTATA